MAFTRDTFVVYDKEFQLGEWERMDQNVQAFNGASQNCIILESDQLQGDYEKSTFFEALDEDAIDRRDPNSTADVDSTDITQGEHVSVNLHRRVGPIDKTLAAWYDIAQTPEQLSIRVGQMVGDLKAKKMLNTSLLAVVNALLSQAGLVYDATQVTGGETLALANMVKGMALMGDAYSRLACWVMHSKPFFDLVGGQVGDKMDSVAGVIVYGGSPATMGKPVIVSDSSSLVELNGSATDEYYTLGLVPGAVRMKDFNSTPAVSDVITGKQNLIGRIQGEATWNVGVKGMAWNTQTGGANPVDAALGNSSNWSKAATSIKDLPGFVIKTQ